MLYEVITRQRHGARIAGDQRRDVVQAFDIKEVQIMSGKNAIPTATVEITKGADVMREAATGNGPRITSYNVCYTKLLRLLVLLDCMHPGNHLVVVPT